MAEQIPLAVQLPDGETFDNFIEAGNAQLIQHLKNLVQKEWSDSDPFITYVSGDAGTGKSHLLYSLCHMAQSHSIQHIYLSLKHKEQFSEQILDGLEQTPLICIDDMDLLLGNNDWQVAMFNLINRVKEVKNSRLVLTANVGPANIKLDLPDLRSRMSWGVSYHLKALSDMDLSKALTVRAQQRGFDLTEEVAHFLINHTPRDMPSLMNVLAQLDQMSLQEKRKITIPFVKAILSI